VLAIRLPEDLEKRLADMARRTGRTKTFYAREAIETYLENLEDYYLGIEALHRVRDGEEAVYSLDEVKQHLGLDD
jgi:RHH-type rel operon transcriptional repressor/antitoxin RelB